MSPSTRSFLELSASESRFHPITGKIVSLGEKGSGSEIEIDSGSSSLKAHLVLSASGTELYVDEGFLLVNQKRIAENVALRHGDILKTAGDAKFIFLSAQPTASLGDEKLDSEKVLRILKILSEDSSELRFKEAIDKFLLEVCELSQAEVAYLVTEDSSQTEWKVISRYLAGTAQNSLSKRELLSHSVLNQALRENRSIVVPNLIGHPLSQSESVFVSKFFSLACCPLDLSGKRFGALFLATLTPGKSLESDLIEKLRMMVTVASLILSVYAEKDQIKKENSRLKRLVDSDKSHSLVYAAGSPMQKVHERALKLAESPLSILILGETGTGKEVMAREIHRNSSRREGPFVAINCAAIPEALMESILFGHRRGSFTGADRDQRGKFEQADGGTIFLDEIGDLPFEVQAKLLRVLQEAKVDAIGSHQSVSVNVRVVAASNVNLEQAIKKKKFREDLFYRLQDATLSLPPLRERRGDLPALIDNFMQLSKTEKILSRAAQEKLLAHSWPGNIRELKQCVNRALVLSEKDVIEVDELELGLSVNQTGMGLDLAEIKDLPLKEAQKAFTQQFVAQVLIKNQGNRQKAALELGISERSLYRVLSERPDGPVEKAQNLSGALPGDVYV